jgi:polyferredoxin
VFAGITALMLFDFVFFREQLCALVCPYGRFQSALLDKDSLTVAYDRARGEPRGKGVRRSERVVGDVAVLELAVLVVAVRVDVVRADVRLKQRRVSLRRFRASMDLL